MRVLFLFVKGLFAGLFATNAWFHILVVATYFAICLTPEIFHLSVSHRKYLANFGAYERIGGTGSLLWICKRDVTAGTVCPAAKSLTPKIFHLNVSHQNILANYGVYERIGISGSFFWMYDVASTGRSGDQFFYPSNRNLRFRREMR